jgi:group I intron endonuclease
MKQIGVYQIRNVVTGQLYIGSSTRSLRHRLAEHLHQLRRKHHHNRHLQNAWLKWGQQNFAFEIIELVEKAEDVREREQFHIDRVQAIDPKFGYNLNDRAAGGLSNVPEVRARHKARLNDPEVRARLLKGRRENPPELTAEGRQRIVEANLGNQRGLGYKHTPEARAAISEKNVGKHGNDGMCRTGKHPWVPENIFVNADGEQGCKACANSRSTKWLDSGNRDDWNRARKERRHAAGISKGGPLGERTHCKHGHPLSGDNLHINPKTGQRVCRACVNWRSAAYHAKLKVALEASVG